MEEETTMIGKQIGTYRLIEEIASGRFGTTYRAKHIQTDGVIALKWLHMHPATAELEHFMQKVQFVINLQHRHILPILEVGLDDGRPYFVSEYVTGGSLRQQLDKMRVLTWDQALTILNQIGEALKYTHQQKIVHCDLKPENILFNAQGEVVVTDFCIATVLATMSLEQLADMKGDSLYMAPEQFLGKVSKKSDQYALACITYEMLTGQLPFSAADLSTLGPKHKELKPIPPRQINKELPAHSEEAILKALIMRRSFRYDDLAAFLKAFQTPPPLYKIINRLLDEGATLAYCRRYEEALRTYQQVIRLLPEMTVAYVGMAEVLVKLERYVEAVEAYDQAIRCNYEVVDSSIGKADVLMKLERYKEAVQVYDQIADVNLSDPSTYNNKGYALCHLKRFEEALTAFEQALRLDPTYIIAYISKGDVLVLLDRFENAVEVYDQALRLYPDFAITYTNKGRALSGLKRYEEALEAYERALELDPDYAITYTNKGYALYYLKRYEEAVVAFEEALRLDPSSRDAFNGKMLTLLGQQTEALMKELGVDEQALNFDHHQENALESSKWNEETLEADEALDFDPHNIDTSDIRRGAQGNVNWLEEALKGFEESLRLVPGNPCALNGKGEVLVHLKRYEEALPALEQALNANPDYAIAYNNKGNALFGLNRYEEALEAYEQALNADPKKVFAAYNTKSDPHDSNWFTEMLVRDMNARQQALDVDRASVYDSKGDALYHLNRYEEALEAYERALRLNPNSVSAYNSKGNTLSKLKRYEEAVKAYDQALRLEPTSVPLYTNKAYALYQLDWYEEAVEVYEQIIRLDPKNPVTYNNKGFALYCLDRYEEALEAYQQSLDLDPNNAVVHTNKGRVLSSLKRYTKALDAYEQALSLDPDYAGAYDGKAMALYYLDRTEEAAQTIEQGHRDDADFYNRKGIALLELDDYEEALSAFEQALRIDPKHVDASSNRSFILALRRVHKIGKAFGLA